MRVREYARAHDPSPSRTRALLARSSSSRDRSHLNLPMRCSPSRRRGRGEERRNERKRRDKKGTLWKYTGRGRSILFVSGCSRGDSKRSPVTRTSSLVEEKKKRERGREGSSIFYPKSLEIVRGSTEDATELEREESL